MATTSPLVSVKLLSASINTMRISMHDRNDSHDWYLICQKALHGGPCCRSLSTHSVVFITSTGQVRRTRCSREWIYPSCSRRGISFISVSTLNSDEMREFNERPDVSSPSLCPCTGPRSRRERSYVLISAACQRATNDRFSSVPPTTKQITNCPRHSQNSRSRRDFFLSAVKIVKFVVVSSRSNGNGDSKSNIVVSIFEPLTCA